MLKIFQIKFFLLLLLNTLLLANSPEYSKNWPTFRGPMETGEAPYAIPPVKWSETENIAWKLEIEGNGLSTPIIWEEKLFITAAIELDSVAVAKLKEQKDHPLWMKASGVSKTTDKVLRFVVLCIDRKTGQILWKKIVNEAVPHEGTHRDGSWAAPSCVTNGNALIASFGSYGIYCFDLNGKLLWEKDLGDLYTRNAFGEGISPALYKDNVIINWDHEKDSYLFVLNLKDGNIKWKKPRDERTSWSTPIVRVVNGKAQIIVAGTTKSIGYDLEDGSEIWYLSGLTGNIVPTPMFQDDLVYLISGFRGAVLQVFQLDKAIGNVAESNALKWTYNQDTPYVPSGLLYHQHLYFFKGNREVLTCLNAKTGDVAYSKQKLEEMKGVYASPLGADGKVYIVGRNGVTYVLKANPVFKVIAVNKLDDRFDASPVAVGDALYLRGLKRLYCIKKN